MMDYKKKKKLKIITGTVVTIGGKQQSHVV